MSQAKEGGETNSAGANANPDWYIDHSKLIRGSLAHSLIARFGVLKAIYDLLNRLPMSDFYQNNA